jgi:kynurenine 3-monooxygenase
MENSANIQCFFEHKCLKLDIEKGEAFFSEGDQIVSSKSDVIIGADGIYSIVRKEIDALVEKKSILNTFDYGYKELYIPENGKFGEELSKSHLHIWPRGSFMLISLPNIDHSFSNTLFMPMQGEPSFSSLNSQDAVESFFGQYFPGICNIVPGISEYYNSSRYYKLKTVHCSNWHYKGTALVMGDSAHAILPFYGQGMNAGFEDCSEFIEMIDHFGDWEEFFDAFENKRKPNTEAIARFSEHNLWEMQSKVLDPSFLLKKNIEAHLHTLYPDVWTSAYSSISFTNTPYNDILEVSKKQQAILEEIITHPVIVNNWQNTDYRPWIQRLQQLQRQEELVESLA